MILQNIACLVKLNIFKENGMNETMVLIHLFWKNMYIFMIWRVPVCGRPRSMDV